MDTEKKKMSKTKSKLYKFVYKMDKHKYRLNSAKIGTDNRWLAKVRRKRKGTCCVFDGIQKFYKNERDAALAVDKFLISIKEAPVNILVKKK